MTTRTLRIRAAIGIRSVLRDYAALPRLVFVLCIGAFINRAGSFVVPFLSLYVTGELGLPQRYGTLSLGALGAGHLLAALIGGQLADSLGRRRVMVVAMLGGALLLSGLAAAESPWLLMLNLFLFGLIADTFRPAMSAMLGDVCDRVTRPMAFTLMYISVNLGFAIAPSAGGFLAEYSYTLLFLADAATMAVFGLIILAAVPETKHLAMHQSEQSGDGRIPWSTAVRRIAADGRFLLFCFANLLSTSVFVQGFSTLPLYIRSLGFSEQHWGLMIATNGVMIVLLQLPVTQLLRRRNHMAVIFCGELLIAVGFGLTGVIGSASWIVFTIAVWTLGEILHASFKFALVAEMAPPMLRGRYMGVFGLCFGLSMTVAAPLGGWVLDRFGSDVLWACCACVSAAAAVLFGVLTRTVSR